MKYSIPMSTLLTLVILFLTITVAYSSAKGSETKPLTIPRIITGGGGVGSGSGFIKPTLAIPETGVTATTDHNKHLLASNVSGDKDRGIEGTGGIGSGSGGGRVTRYQYEYQ